MTKGISHINLSHLKIDDVDSIFRSEDRDLLEDLAHAARDLTRQHFGRTMGLYAPLYISNYCQNHCVYCGFHVQADLERSKLTCQEIDRECAALAATGIRSCLILTGESRYHSSPHYIREAIGIAAAYFPNIDLEIYPLETEEYREMYQAGADGVTLYQETYNRDRYGQLHLSGPKKDYDRRVGAPERIAQAGFRHISLGVLLGLADWREDITRLFAHVRSLERQYPGVEYGLSFPRLRPVSGDSGNYMMVSDREMITIICTARLLFPRAVINLSTREDARFRDLIIELGVTKISAGSSTKVGGYIEPKADGDDGQFPVHDTRTLAEVKEMLMTKGFDPVVTDWRNIVNE